ncbi:MAG: type IV toxin-antitoxin system AbiEi family antitoxin, partial [Acidobacteriota bacterium]|nr:type IV toxin-antitoxin system AbiEi family antitoxin [Acidobacteriota bacterium]
EILRPKLSEMRFEAERFHWWEEAVLAKIPSACWSGEVAADMLTDYLEPTQTLIYAKNVFLPLLVSKHKLRKVIKGNIKIRRKFWNFNNDDKIAPPLLVYADLLATAESRNLEAAQIIYDEHLARLVE